jgi:hypothetical protein
MADSFQAVLRKWTGAMPKKEAAARLGVPLSTFYAWWAGKTKPAKLCESCLLAKMGVK